MTFPNFPESSILLVYDEEGNLRSISFNEACKDALKNNLAKLFPVRIEMLKHAYFRECQIKDSTNIDVSFEAFWNTYNFKVGKVMRVKAKWNKLSVQDRQLAMLFIPKYKQFKEKTNSNLQYPETYINQRTWETVLPK
jgi:competence transcription factor ComK